MRRRLPLLAALTGLLALLPAPARAQDDATPTAAGDVPEAEAEASGAEAEREPTPLEVARDHMEQGQALYLQGRYLEAAEEFIAAYNAQNFAAFLYNAGVALERAGDAARAAEFFERYLEQSQDATDRGSVEARIARLRAAIAPTPAPTPPEGQEPPPPEPPAPEEAEEFKSLLSVRTNPEGAQVTVLARDAVVAEAPSPFAYTLDQGAYTIRVEHPDYQTIEQAVTIQPGRVYVVIVEMSQGDFYGFLRVVSNVPGADVYIDDREEGARGQTPFEAPMPIGNHRIWVERPGYGPEESEAEVNIGEHVTVRIDLTRVDYGRLRVISNRRGARVLLDGEQVGEVPYEGEHPAGEHQLVVVDPGYKAFVETVTIRRGQLTPVQTRLRPDVDRTGAVITTVVAGLFLAAGVTGAVLTNVLFRDPVQADRDAGILASNDSRLDLGIAFAAGTDIAFGVALIFGIVALVQFVSDPLPPSEGTVLEARDWALLPGIDPERQSLSLQLSGSF